MLRLASNGPNQWNCPNLRDDDISDDISSHKKTLAGLFSMWEFLKLSANPDFHIRIPAFILELWNKLIVPFEWYLFLSIAMQCAGFADSRLQNVAQLQL